MTYMVETLSGNEDERLKELVETKRNVPPLPQPLEEEQLGQQLALH